MKCEEFARLLDNYESLTPEEKVLMDAHAKECAECGRELDFMLSVINAAKTLPKINVPEDFLEKLNRRIDAEEKPLRRGGFTRHIRANWQKYSALAACMVLAAVIGANYDTLIDNMNGGDGGVISEVVSAGTPAPDTARKAEGVIPGPSASPAGRTSAPSRTSDPVGTSAASGTSATSGTSAPVGTSATSRTSAADRSSAASRTSASGRTSSASGTPSLGAASYSGITPSAGGASDTAARSGSDSSPSVRAFGTVTAPAGMEAAAPAVTPDAEKAAQSAASTVVPEINTITGAAALGRSAENEQADTDNPSSLIGEIAGSGMVMNPRMMPRTVYAVPSAESGGEDTVECGETEDAPEAASYSLEGNEESSQYAMVPASDMSAGADEEEIPAGYDDESAEEDESGSLYEINPENMIMVAEDDYDRAIDIIASYMSDYSDGYYIVHMAYLDTMLAEMDHADIDYDDYITLDSNYISFRVLTQ